MTKLINKIEPTTNISIIESRLKNKNYYGP